MMKCMCRNMLFCRNKKNRYNNSTKVICEDETKRRSGIISKSIDIDNVFDKVTVTYPKTRADEDLIRTAIRNNEFLTSILLQSREQKLIDSMYKKEVTPGQVIIRQGEVGSHLYISNAGTFEILVNGLHVNTFDDVRVFGELAILYSSKRFASVRSLTRGSIWVLECPMFKKLIIKTSIEEQEETVSFLKNVPKLNTVPIEKLYQVANLFHTEFFATGQEIVKQCEIGNKFYIIKAGNVTVEKDGKRVAHLSKGQYFGELALLKNEFRQASVIADQPGVECLTLTRKEFIDHFGDIEDFTKLKTGLEAHPEAQIEYANLDLNNLQVIRTIGSGAYGRVQLVQHVTHKNYVFAMKCIKKVDMRKQSHQSQIFSEKYLHISCNNPFIVKMYRTFRDSRYLYFLLEACLGGDLWGHLHKQKKRCFDENTARFYAGCILEAINYLHKSGIIYRDLKPENMVIHHSGYLKLADFGFAKQTDLKEKTYTFVGTAEYVAPEIIQNKGYNRAVDYWAFGIFIYELLTGRTPFRTNDPGHLNTYKLILKGMDSVLFPGHLSKKAKHIIRKLCRLDPLERLGCMRGGVGDICNHPWFTELDWSKLRRLELEPPHKPHLQTITDTKYFDIFKEETKAPEEDFSSWDRGF